MTEDVWVTSVEVYHLRNRWVVKAYRSNDNHKTLIYKRLKTTAVSFAQGYAAALGDDNWANNRGLEVVVKGRNGKIQTKSSYGYDPESSVG